jgi:D-alanyl-D-alanine carboxypeptidase
MAGFSRTDLNSYIDLFSRWVDRQLLDRDQPGLSAAIIHDQEVIWTGGFGYADVDRKIAATPQTIYGIGSITKVFTALAIQQLRKAGKLGLDDAVTKHLPWFNILPFQEQQEDITIRHLLTHTGGLPPHLVVPGEGRDPLTVNIQQVKQFLPRHQCLAPAGGEFRYSNLGYSLLGQIIEHVAGVSFADYVERNILQPLGMAQTFARHDAIPATMAAVGYGRRLPRERRAVYDRVDMRTGVAAGGMVSTVEDLARFAMFHVSAIATDRCGVLDEKVMREMLHPYTMLPGGQIGQGFAWRVEQLNDCTTARHSGTVPGFQAGIELHLEEKIGIVVLTNSTDGDASHYLKRLYNWVGKGAQHAAETVTSESAPASFDQYIGKYRSAWVDIEVFMYQGRLALMHPSSADPMVICLDRAEANVFRVTGPSMDLAVFNLNETGDVASMFLGGVQFDRIAHW